MVRLVGLLGLALLCTWGTACTDPDSTVPSDIEPGCFGWPEEAFSKTNSAMLTTALEPGETAIDFTLRDPEGTRYRLTSLLETKPVLMVFGAFT
jgi:hypothetical protein